MIKVMKVLRFINYLAMILDLLFPTDEESVEEQTIIIMAKKVREKEAICNSLLVYRTTYSKIKESLTINGGLLF